MDNLFEAGARTIYDGNMPLRKVSFAEGEYYHICGRGQEKKDIFLNENDRLRFLFSLLFYQSLEQFDNLRRYMQKFSISGHELLEVANLSAKIVLLN